jgi:microsomal epoxide hydrolase
LLVGALALPVSGLGLAIGTTPAATRDTPIASASMVPPALHSRRFTTSDGVRLHYLENDAPALPNPAPQPGAAAPVTLVFVPGWTMPAWIWQHQLAHFAARHPVLALDPRGQGQSGQPSGGYDYARRAADIAELLNHAAAGREVVLVGWSLGVLECLQLVHDARQPGAALGARVRALVLVDNSVGVGEPPTSDPTFFTRLRAKRGETLAGFVRGMFKQPPNAAWLDELTQAALRTPLQASIDLLRQPRPREFWRDALYAAGMPVLYAYTPKFAQQGEIVKARLQGGIETQLFAEAGHALFVDEPARFNELLERFVARVAAGGPASAARTSR